MRRNESWKMKSATIFLAAFSLIFPLPAACLAPSRRSDGSPRVVSLDLERQKVRDPVAADAKRLQRRAGTVNAIMENDEILYFLNGTLGSPPQRVRMHLDTGSSDFWVNSANSELCATKGRPCSASGTYNANASSSYKYVGSFFNISYVDGSGASGDYVTDTLRLFDQDVDNFQFGVGYVSTSPQAVLGIGYPANEAHVVRLKLPEYDNLPAKMAADKIISSNAYSLWLNDIDAQDGTILFGGIDKARFEEPLVSLPIQKVDDRYVEFYVTMTALSIGPNKIAEDMAMAVLLDSGSSFTYLPSDLTQSIYQALGARYEKRDGVAYVPCSLRDKKTTMTFRFSDPAAIEVAMRELVIDPKDLPSGRPLTFGNGASACYCSILPSDNAVSVLGDTFLRSAYVVYDLENHRISLAKTRFNASFSDIEEIGQGGDAVPQAVMAQRPVAAASGIPSRSSRNGVGGGGRGGVGGGNSKDSGAAGPGGAAPPASIAALAVALSFLLGAEGCLA